ncbi:hypothetical protein [Dactylosporangium sp. CA-233914]|uniref:hypothetical protein n=1 Tax=Dactylosporangium sp. CA-233914 TaxID=3239934 RepID=UPI003D9158F3
MPHADPPLQPNHLLTAARRRLTSPARPGRSMSRSELADAVNRDLYAAGVRDVDVDANYIGKLERGLHRWPTAARRSAFQRVLGATAALDLGFYNPRPPRDDTAARSWPAQNHAAAPLPVAAPAADLTQDQTSTTPDTSSEQDVLAILQRIHRLNRTIDPEIIRQLRNLVTDIVARYEQFDHAEIRPKLVKQRAWVATLLEECNHPGQRQQLFEIAVAASGLLGYLAVGHGQHHLARAYCAEAFTLGELAQTPNLQAWARGLQSFCEYYAQDYDAALRFAEDGLVHASAGPQSVRLMVNGVARALGKLGDADGVHRAVDSAYNLMARNDTPDGFPSSVSFHCYSPAQTASNAATAYVSLGLADHVDRYIGLALPEVTRSGSPWSRSLVMLDQASALVASKHGDLERASRLAIDAVGLSAGRPIIAVQQRTMDFVRHATRQWGDAKQIRAVHDAVADEVPS